MKEVAIFLDRDGVINKDKGHTHLIEGFQFYKDLFRNLKKLPQTYKIIIITNQAGIAKGIFTEKTYDKLTNFILKQFKKEKINITEVYHCPHHIDGIVKKYTKKCNCRKPATGMIEKAQKEHKLDLAKSWLIGDKETDIQAGKSSKCKTILLNRSRKYPQKTNANFQVRNLTQAIKKKFFP